MQIIKLFDYFNKLFLLSVMGIISCDVELTNPDPLAFFFFFNLFFLSLTYVFYTLVPVFHVHFTKLGLATENTKVVVFFALGEFDIILEVGCAVVDPVLIIFHCHHAFVLVAVFINISHFFCHGHSDTHQLLF